MNDEMKKEVIKAAADGYSAEEIAQVLNLDEQEVKVLIAKSTDAIAEEKTYRQEV